MRPPRVAMPPPAPPPVTHPLVGRRSLSYSCRPHASPLFPVDAPDRHHSPPARAACAPVHHCAQVKHEVRPFDGERPCHRSVIVQFIRHPVKDGSDKILLDL